MLEKHHQKTLSVDTFHSGFVAITGAPNAGKSTLLNIMLGQKISITSKKPQTTRNRILGILTNSLSQFVFIDTPGVHKAKNTMNAKIVEVALTSITDADLALLVIDVSNPNPKAEQLLIDKLKSNKKSVILVMNKIDKIKKNKTLKLIANWSNIYQFDHIVPVCARSGEQVPKLITLMQDSLPEGAPFFPTNSLTNMSEKFIVSEIIREKIFRLTGQEIPYSVAVTVDSFEKKTSTSSIFVYGTIHVERNSQKGIIIGKNGKKLKVITKEAELEIQKILDYEIFIDLLVRVEKNWSKNTKTLRKFGY